MIAGSETSIFVITNGGGGMIAQHVSGTGVAAVREK